MDIEEMLKQDILRFAPIWVKELNEARNELATMQVALEAQSEEIARYKQALKEIIAHVPVYVFESNWAVAKTLSDIYTIANKALPAKTSEDES